MAAAAADPLLGRGHHIIMREQWLGLTEEPVLEPSPLGIGPFTGRQHEVFPEWKQRMLALAALCESALCWGST